MAERTPCLKTTRPLAKPLRPRGADVVLGHRLEQVAAQEARVDRGERGGEHAPRHDQRRDHLAGIGEDVAGRRIGALALEERELAEVLGEEVQRDEAEPVDRGRDRDERGAHRRAVHPGAALDGGDDADRDADEQPHDGAAGRERRGGGQPVEDLRLDRDVVLVAVAEVEVEDQPVQVLQVLDVPRLVEAERVADRGEQLRGGLAPGAQRRRVGRRQRVEDHEGQEADHEEQHDHPEQPADDEGDHGVGLRAVAVPEERRPAGRAGGARAPQCVSQATVAASYFSDVKLRSSDVRVVADDQARRPSTPTWAVLSQMNGIAGRLLGDHVVDLRPGLVALCARRDQRRPCFIGVVDRRDVQLRPVDVVAAGGCCRR